MLLGGDDRIPGPCLISSSADADTTGPEPTYLEIAYIHMKYRMGAMKIPRVSD